MRSDNNNEIKIFPKTTTSFPRTLPMPYVGLLMLATTILTYFVTFQSTTSSKSFELNYPSPLITSLTNRNATKSKYDLLYETLSKTERLKRCPFPIVYNKPAKTGSTFIQRAIEQWALKVHRPIYKCGSIGSETILKLSECLPYKDFRTQECGVMTNHIDIDNNINTILNQRMPNYRLITSTRYSPHRVVSNYLQAYHIRINSTNNDISEGLKNYLTNEFDPEVLLPAHFGFDLPDIIPCPVSNLMKKRIYSSVANYFIVIDVNLVKESNIILNHFGLFQLAVSEDSKVNRRGAGECVFDDDVKKLLYNVTCFDREVHLALQMRMASLYEMVTGIQCFKRSRSSLFNCLQSKESQLLKETWHLDERLMKA